MISSLEVMDMLMEAMWSDVDCPGAVTESNGFVNTAMACYLCYFPFVAVAVHSIFFLVFIGLHVRSQTRSGQESKQTELAQMHTVAKYLCILLIVLDVVRCWLSESRAGLPLYISEALAWLIICVALQREEMKGRAIYRSILKAWWVALLGLSTAVFIPSVMTGRFWNAGFAFVPLISSLLLAVISFSGYVYKDRVGQLEGLDTPLLSESSRPEEVTASESGFSKASLPSVISFWWLNPLLAIGNKRPLTIPDIPLLDPVDAPTTNYEAFQEQWKRQRLATPPADAPSMPWTLFKTFWQPFLASCVLMVLWVSAQFVAPLLQNQLITFMEAKDRTFARGITLAAILLGGKLAESSFGHQLTFRSRKLGLRMWAAVGCSVYNKSLRLSLKARQVRSVGEIINIISVDRQRLLDVAYYVQQGLVIPVQVVVAVIILFKVVGVAMLAGLSSLILVLVLNSLIVRRMRSYRARMLVSKDMRMRATTECLGNLKAIKLQAWDDMFLERIEALREDERGWIKKFMYAWATAIYMVWNGPFLLAGVTFFTMFLLGEDLTAARVYTALTTFKIIQDPIRSLPDIVANLIQTTVSIERIGTLMVEDEVDPDAVEKISDIGSCEYAVELEGAAFTWDRLSTEPALKDLDLKIKRGSCVAICGAVGSGKSTLLFCMMGELPRLTGTAKLCGRVAYVAQSAWIQNNTIKQNILFGLPIEHDRYKEAVRVAGLETDLAQFPDGDETEIGERGTTLSGGQKQRVQLARAVYQDADVYVLDDPFSAVDAHTGTFLFEQCVKKALKGKTVILVTHQVEFLPGVDQIIVMRAPGEIVQRGTYNELVQEGKDFGVFVEALQESLQNVIRASQTDVEEGEELEELLDSVNESLDPLAGNEGGEGLAAQLSGKYDRASSLSKTLSRRRSNRTSEAPGAGKETKGKLIEEEIRAVGRVEKRVVWAYFSKVGKGLPWTLVPIPQLATTGFTMLADLWLANGTSSGTATTLRFMLIYMAILGCCSICVFIRTRLVAWIGIATGQAFFTDMLLSIIRAPMSFIDATPVGRILARASSDQSTLDTNLPNLVAGVGNNLIGLIGNLVITTYVTPQILLLMIPLGYIFYRIQVYYINSSRELARLTALTEAPLFLHISESIGGATTIRAFQDQPRFSSTNVQRLEPYQRSYFHNMSAAEWLGFRLDILSATILTGVAILLITLPEDQLTPGLAGLSLSYSLTLSSVLMRLVQSSSMAERKLVSVERVLQYSDIKSEAPTVIPDRRPAPGWPDAGRIELQQLKIRYRPDLPMVLKGVSCVIHPREKVGVVGRTGSGKSTLVQALFRLIEPAGGAILIDGLDITSIGLNDLRSVLGVIAQEPILFEGTIRSNLDPFNAYTDLEIWESLDKCQLGQVVRDKSEKLNSTVTEQGENWSVGERQLLCLARALLKHARILVLDEATASVDISTDAVIQLAIKRYFADCTVISVAHRIPTVIDSDRVLVLDQGILKENNSPEHLLANENSMFYKLVKEYTSRTDGSSNSDAPE